MSLILYLLYYLVAISALVLHFTGHLERWRMQWVLVLAVTVFPVVLYL
jgi:low affinity Fe/Cu permease